jgi:hypothetical protein
MPAPTALVAVAGTLSEAIAAVQAGADVVDFACLADPGDLADPGGLADPGDLADPGGLADPGDLADPADAEQDVIGQFRARCPGVLVCGSGQTADLVRDPAVALATGALLICGDPGAALASRLPPRQVIVEVAPGAVLSAAQAGWATLVDADRAAELAAGRRSEQAATSDQAAALAGIVAVAAVSSWLGATAVRTRHPLQVRRALEMSASIQGTRPPARSVRGLA